LTAAASFASWYAERRAALKRTASTLSGPSDGAGTAEPKRRGVNVGSDGSASTAAGV
jgi:hypothetical protein